ncbi:MAG: right-handed parallel beta-helix repeat-containing protein [Gemmatimonadota bacterium]|nr:right-handed parallel beta-helix repeat-containing protein [Gemmatimonadota bacterium]
MNLMQKIALCLFVALIACGGDKPTGQEEDNTRDGLDRYAHRFDITENQTSDFGMNTPGGRGGRVIRVTNLSASGQGSLNEALSASGPRIVVFEVGGAIDLNKAQLTISEPYVTVAGQTAPSPGITIIRGAIFIETHDVIVQHIRVRPGDAGEPKRSGWEPDGISTWGGEAYNVLIDHCSISWAVDENLSASGPRTEGPDATSHRITFRNCIISEGLHDASHSGGPHSKGSLIHDFCREIAIIGNLYAHNVERSPLFKASATGVIVNNLIYNPGSRAIHLNLISGQFNDVDFIPQNARVSVVGNVMIHGNDTRSGLALVSATGDAYLEDNISLDRTGANVPLTSGNIRILEEKPIWGNITPLPASAVVEHVVASAGARPKDRDAIDKRIIHEFRAREGRMIDSQQEVGGYPEINMVRRPLDIPPDVDAWLAQLATELEGK